MDLFGWFVATQTEKPGMSQATVVRPFGEADLGDQFRFDPMRALVGKIIARERRLLLLLRGEALAQFLECLIVVSRAHLSSVNQAVRVVVADQQRPKTDARSPWVSV